MLYQKSPVSLLQKIWKRLLQNLMKELRAESEMKPKRKRRRRER